jgi:2-hydroxy-3-keto-5-methylthiopentenyl-1-phosphate phosphatase
MTAPLPAEAPVVPEPPFIIVCDFDGTITVEDVTNLIWDAHLPYDWRNVLLPPSREGRLTALEMIARGYGDVPAPAETLLAEVRPHVRLRAGWARLVDLCRERRWPLEVVSHGLGFYIRDILPPGASLTAFEGTYDGRRWQVSLPPGVELASGGDFKSHVLATLRARHPGHATLYIGDGRLDFPAARRTDLVFAVRDSVLAHLCVEEGVPSVSFDTFDEIADALAQRAGD